MAIKSWIFLAVVVALTVPGWSQQTSGWRVYRVADGLSDAACTSVTVSLNGKVLVTHPSPGAISELDGYAAHIFPWQPAPGGAVGESPGGQLWAISAEGLKEWKDKRWVLHPVPEIAAEFQRNPARAHAVPFLPVQQGRVLFLLPDRLMEFNVEELNRPRIVVLRAAAQTRLETFTGMNIARDGGLWISGARGLAKAPAPVRALQPTDNWQEFLLPESSEVQNLRRPNEDEDGGVTLVAESNATGRKGAVYFDGEHWKAMPFGAEEIRCAWRGPDKLFRAITADALLQWREGRAISREPLSARQYFDAAVEPGGAFWLATSDGLFRFALPAWRIPEELQQLTSRIRALAGDTAGRLWFLGDGKLNWLQHDTLQQVALPETVRPPQTGSLFPMKNGSVLLTAAEGWFQFLPDSKRFELVRAPDSKATRWPLGRLKDGSVCSKTVAPGGKAPLLEVFDGTRFGPFPYPAPEDLETYAVLFAAQNGDLWMGGRGVALCRDGKWQAFVSNDKTTPESAVGFAELADGRIWCGTLDKIWEFNGKDWTVVRAGFDRLAGLFRARDGSVWAASDAGLHHYSQGTWIDNGMDEGLPSEAVHGMCEDQQGRIWAETSRGLARYYPEADLDAPKTEIQKLSAEDQQLLEGDTISLLFHAQDKWKFTPRDRLLYSYRLDQHDWSFFQDLNGVTFPDLIAGKHFVQVRSMDRNGNLESPVRLEFAVALPWYRETRLVTISFIGLALALFFAGLSYNRHRQLLRSYAEVERKVAERTRELEIANRELLHSQKMNALGTLAAGIAHDFNNILSIIKGSAQIIEENPGDTQKVSTRVDRIKTVVEQGSGIVKAMLGFSRDSGDQPDRCDPNNVVDDTLKLLGDRFLREVELQFERGDRLPEVPASKDFIQQILLNFIFNAAESMTQRKQLILATHLITQLPAGVVLLPAASERYVTIEVRDFGTGITPEHLPRIFEPFFTTKSLSARRGTGLGLSMVYELAKKMAAGLAVATVVNEGSVFILILPAGEKK